MPERCADLALRTILTSELPIGGMPSTSRYHCCIDGEPDDDSTPSSEVADQAVNVVLHGGKRNHVTVATAKADRGATAGVVPAGDRPESKWTKTATICTVLSVLVAIIAAYFTYRQWRG